jgi:hypothetical protein
VKLPEWIYPAFLAAVLATVIFGPWFDRKPDASIVPTPSAEPTAAAVAPPTVLASLLASYRALAARRGELARERPDAFEDEELRREEVVIVELMREEARRSPDDTTPEVESILDDPP